MSVSANVTSRRASLRRSAKEHVGELQGSAVGRFRLHRREIVPLVPLRADRHGRFSNRAADPAARPWQAIDLLWSIRLRPTAKKDQPLQLEPESEQALLAWCAEHG